MMFNGTEDMNGIPCDVWVGCLFIPDGKITINVKYHFSSKFKNTWQNVQMIKIHRLGRRLFLRYLTKCIYFSSQNFRRYDFCSKRKCNNNLIGTILSLLISPYFVLSCIGNDSDARWFTAGGSSSAPIGIHAKGQSAEDKSFKLEQTFNYIYFSEQFTSLDQEYFAKIFEVNGPFLLWVIVEVILYCELLLL